MSMRDKSYQSSHPVLPDIINHGWTMNQEERLTLLICLNKPAPIAVLNVIKCGCQTECIGRCSCTKTLCHAHHSGLGISAHSPDYRQVADDDSKAPNRGFSGSSNLPVSLKFTGFRGQAICWCHWHLYQTDPGFHGNENVKILTQN